MSRDGGHTATADPAVELHEVARAELLLEATRSQQTLPETPAQLGRPPAIAW